MRRYIKQLNMCLLALFLLFLFTQCEKNRLQGTYHEDGLCGKMWDYDGNEYDMLRLGNQVWMAQNLRTTHYANGTSIPLGNSTSTTTAYRYCPNNIISNVSKFGYLYNWKAVMGNSSSSSSNPSYVQGICPDGWHVPSEAEWDQLVGYIDDYCYPAFRYYRDESGSVGKALASTELWEHSNFSAESIGYYPEEYNNSTRFSALPAGIYHQGGFSGFGEYTGFWSSTGVDYYSLANSFYLDYEEIFNGCQHENRVNGLSVRCVKN
jgi:uncharacterized protein (TIGR02145 family)